MIACLLVGNDIKLRAEFACFLCNQRADAIYGGLIVRGRFCFYKKFQELF
jgi:hypothetical protein